MNAEKVSIIKNCSGREGLHFIQTLTTAEQEMCKSSAEQFETLNEKFNSQHNEKILSLQYCKLLSDSDQSAEDT